MPKDLFENNPASTPKDLFAVNNIQAPVQASVSTMDKVSSAVSNNPFTSAGMAVIGGLAEGGADIAQGIGDVPTFILDKLGAISPQTAKKLYAANKENADIFRSSSNPGDVLDQAKKNNPIIYGAAKLGADTAGMAGAMRTIPLLGQAAKGATSGLDSISPYLSQGAGLAGRSVGMGVINQAGADVENKDSAFLLGAGSQPLFEKAGAMTANYFSPRANTILDLQQQAITNKGQTKNINALYNKVKGSPFTQEDQGSVYNLSRKTEAFIESNPNLSGQQKSILQNDVVQKLANADSHESVLEAYKAIGSSNKAFKGYGSAVYDFYKSTRDELGGILTNASKRAGEVDDVLGQASQAANQQRILTKVFSNIINQPGKFNPNKASDVLYKEIDGLVKNEANPEMIQSMRGLNRVLKELPKAPYISPTVAAAAVGAAGGFSAGGIGAGVGALSGGALAAYLNSFVKTEQGLQFLSSLAKPGVKQQDVRNVVKALGLSATEYYKNQATQKMYPSGPTPMPDGPVGGAVVRN